MAMITTQQTKPHYDLETVKAANKIMDWLTHNVHKDYKAVLEQHFDVVQRSILQQRIEYCLDERDAVLPARGAIARGTVYIRNKAGVEGEAGAKAITALKEQNRIVQCGSGRGKVIVLIDNKPLPEPKQEALPIPATEAVQHQQESNTIKQLKQDLDALTTRVDKLQVQLEEQAVATWR